jgi:predicted permease
VIGVLPPVPQYPVESDVYMPTWQCPSRRSPRNIANANFRLISAVFGRLKPGVTVEQARAELGVAAARVSAAHPEGYRTGNFAVSAAPLQWALTRKAETPFLILLAVAGFVLLIACANVANMMLARLLKLERELAVRAALGASRARLIFQLLTESVLVSAAGGAIGLAIAPLALNVLVGFAERFTTRAAEVRVDGPILLFAVILSAGAGLLFGLAPALSPWQHIDSLHQGGRATANRSRQMLRGGLVIAQVAVSFILLIGAGLMIRSFLKIERQNPGFDASRLLSMRVSLQASSGGEFRNRMTEVTRKTRTVPGVEAAALVSNAPFSKTNVIFGPGSTEFEIEGRPSSKGEGATVDTTAAQEGYFETVRQPLRRGRTFTEHDNEQSPKVAVVNETMARHRWPAEDPVSRRVTFDHGQTWLTIVGVVGDAHEYGLDRHVADEMYLPLAQGNFANSLVVRTTGDPGRMVSLVRAAIHELDPYIALDQISTTESLQYESMASPRLMAILLGLFAGLAVLISATGIAAVMALAVRQRTNELGIRMALGAQRSRIVSMVVKQGLVLALAGTAVGIAGAIALTRLLKVLLFDTSPTDLATFCAVSLLFLTVAAVACFIPARQVTAIDPLHALRQE